MPTAVIIVSCKCQRSRPAGHSFSRVCLGGREREPGPIFSLVYIPSRLRRYIPKCLFVLVYIPMKNFNIISNIHNGSGLECEAEIIRRLIVWYGHKATCTMFTDKPPDDYFDVNIFVETVAGQFIGCARENWLIPNSE